MLASNIKKGKRKLEEDQLLRVDTIIFDGLLFYLFRIILVMVGTI
jgi:hypothetical protein